MANRIIPQRRGRGGPSYRTPSHRYIGKISYPYSKKSMKGEVIDIVNSVGHSAPLAFIEFEDKSQSLIPVAKGLYVGKQIEYNSNKNEVGNIARLSDISSGTFIYNVEAKPGDKGKLFRSAGSFAQVVSKSSKGVEVKMPSKKKKIFSSNCLATIGVCAGSGRKAKPILKAGKAHHIHRAKNTHFPKVKGVAMNVNEHPHGGTHRRNLGRPITIKRSTPPGRKTGLIAAKRTGRKNK